MKLPFTKMTGAGNDFVMVDNRQGLYSLDTPRIAALCDRHFGVGADGVLLVEPGEKGADFRMRYYNADGSETMCGNGARCFAQFVRHLGAASGPKISFDTFAGRVEADYVGDEIKLNLPPPQDWQLSRQVETPDGPLEVHSISTGNPHVVVFVPDAAAVDVARLGPILRYHSAFAPAGTNAHFVQVTGPDSLYVRSYERGVEGETLACGTGVTASVLIAHKLGKIKVPGRATVKGRAVLTVDFTPQYENVTLQGPALVLFEGTISWN